MKKLKHSILAIVIASLTLSSCTDNFEEINTDPNRLDAISPSTLLNPILYGVTNHNSYSAYFYRNAFLMQTIVPFPSDVEERYDRYFVTENIGTTMWNNHYRWLKNIEEMLVTSEAAGDQNYKAVALTLKAWCYANLVDCFGDIPFSEASQGESGISNPKFDDQREIYNAIFNYLEEANSIYDTSKTSNYTADLLYANDFSKWKKLTNSIHLRLLLQVSDAQPVISFQKINTLLNDPATYPIFESNTDNAILINTGITPNITPWPRIQDFRGGARKLSTFFIDNLVAMEDPRLPIWATKAKKNNEEIGYKGVPSGFFGNEALIDYAPSEPNDEQAKTPMKNFIMTYAEIEFIKAELMFKGQLAGDAKTAYEKGITAAIQTWGVQVPSNYFENPNNQFNNTLEQIMLHKYFALHFNDNQQWNNFRRTGFPVMPLVDNIHNNGVMPSRYPYPPNIKQQNKNEYLKAVENMGGDDMNIKIWWDIN
ncbi:SusD/RagB family nutrient-binding outer membrane lipoprotein [Paenimyroides tangerinum]|uniref:SusD/RagB family nutrient-binding outer membrane lipoprotein n=1 Tax=Paenimyroides tangerinum TaxID=2488728 RepID=A0A3P3WBE2_9FLAO|nr:SusD/RagB family nutrient-binding outer membrane lipoprotein [Paenimyroides tangerinum]RRJ90919.1 SusD/RagB family nutrient-binding outer membrane lipoprotein [Paenimyroides tangerinum]